jgi:TonB family protein
MKRFSAKEKLILCFLIILMMLLHGSILFIKTEEISRKKISNNFHPLTITFDHRITRQIVRSEDSETREVKDAAFLSDKTRAFNRQLKAANHGYFREGVLGGGSDGKHKNLKLSDLSVPQSDNPLSNLAHDLRHKKNNDRIQSHSSMLSSTNDFIKDIPLGEVTNLNTAEFKYFGYYQRIRQRLEQFWGQSIAAKTQQLANNGIKIHFKNDYMTTLFIILDQEGEIIAIKIKASSGINEFDEAAIESFNQAGPFPNPPRDLIVDGRVTLVWGFVVEG